MRMGIGLYVGRLHNHQAVFKTLPKLGVTMVFGSPNLRAASLASKEGLEYFCVDWVFGLPPSRAEGMLIRDCSGSERVWGHGSSGCPSNPSLTAIAARRIARTLRSGRFRGLMLDGIRYPSFTEELAVFLTCFCPNCVRDAADHGINLRHIRHSIPLMLEELRNQTDPENLLNKFIDNPDLLDLLRLRELVIAKVLKDLRKAIGEFAPRSLLGAFLFPPSLARFVGQDYAALGEQLDLVSPMIYTSGEGAACLNAEILNLVKALSKFNSKIRHSKILEAIYRKLRIHQKDLPLTLHELERAGLPPEIVKNETQLSRSKLPQGPTLIPILMLSRQAARIRIESRYAKKSQADGISFFQYNPDHVSSLKAAIKEWT